MVDLQAYRLRILNEVAPKPIASPVICKCNHCFDYKLSAKIKIYFNLQNNLVEINIEWRKEDNQAAEWTGIWDIASMVDNWVLALEIKTSTQAGMITLGKSRVVLSINSCKL